MLQNVKYYFTNLFVPPSKNTSSVFLSSIGVNVFSILKMFLFYDFVSKFNIYKAESIKKNGPDASRTRARRGLGNRRSILLSYEALSNMFEIF